MPSLARSHEGVRPWALHIIHEAQTRSVQRALRTNLAVLQREIGAIGTDWRLGEDGQLTLDGRPLNGRDDVVDAVRRAAGGVATIFAGDTRIATNVLRPDGARAVGTKLAPGPARDAVIGRGESYRGAVDILGVPHMTVYEPIREASGRPAGILFVGVALAEAEVSAGGLLREVLLAGWAAVPMACALGWSALRSRLLRAPGAGRLDQLGEIGRGIRMVRDEAVQALEAEKRTAAARAAQEARQEGVSRLTQEFGVTASRVVAELERSAEETRGAATGMADAAERTRLDMRATSGDAETSSRSLAAVSAAAGQLTGSVGEISRQVALATDATGDAVARARTTGATVQGLSETAGQISEIVSLISEIASKTNLLALNATIEAARAGEAGRGFAVVANEVKQLAAQTAQATGRIGVQVAAIQSATGEAVQAVREVTTAINRVSEVAGVIAAAVDQQGAATREIMTKVQGVAELTDKAAHAMRAVCATAEQSGATSRAVVHTADRVAGQSSSLRAEVDRFLGTIRAV